MHKDVEPFAEAFADAQKAFLEFHRRLEESSALLFRISVDAPTFYAVSREHARLFDQWSQALHAVDDKTRELHAKALEVAGIPRNHPLWSLAGKTA